MYLTGKCKEDFEKWFLYNFRVLEKDAWALLDLKSFYRLHNSLKWGVMQDFFDSKGFEVCIDRSVDAELNFINAFDWVVLNVHTGENYGGGEIEETRPEARKASIQKANEIYNSEKYDENNRWIKQEDFDYENANYDNVEVKFDTGETCKYLSNNWPFAIVTHLRERENEN